MLRNTTSISFIKQLKCIRNRFVTCIRNRFQQKDHIENLQEMEILLLKALRNENFDHELQQMSSFFSSDFHKFKLETQLKTLTHIVYEKLVGIKDSITIISSLNASQKLLVSEALRLAKVILTVPATNAVSERLCSTLHRFKFYLRSSITQEQVLAPKGTQT